MDRRDLDRLGEDSNGGIGLATHRRAGHGSERLEANGTASLGRDWLSTAGEAARGVDGSGKERPGRSG
jgi:hypothetical protein